MFETKLSLSAFFCLAICACFINQVGSVVVDGIQEIDNVGKIRYVYDDQEVSAPCQTLVWVGVGTGMKVCDYDDFARATVEDQPSIVTVIADHNPRRLVKLSPEKYANLVNVVLSEQLGELIPACAAVAAEGKLPIVVVGGHSASGQAAMNALAANLFDFDVGGFIGLDPYNTANVNAKLSIPTLLWGLERTTCGVNPEGASKNTYLNGVEDGVEKIFYEVDNPRSFIVGSVTHCMFTDQGCYGPVCPARQSQAGPLKDVVGISVQLFAEVLQQQDGNSTNATTPDVWTIPTYSSNTVLLYVNDMPAVALPSNGTTKSWSFLRGNKYH